ncbi:MAG: carbon storage regulator [Thermanaeromonas sp.]|uniref:carbon storage regulator n=1 Tax=Thermanaeromonas sp. TaxID=2003697 RepID=UPI00243B6175|nr:carbon storage regulator [Thermanaeromonas sp.]MCG0277746.1 carbon storage regulator [Thermanaeromonas sp.]
MLVLSRKENQSIIIDGHIKVTIVQIAKSQVRVGIEAPDGVRILRAEVLEKHRTPVEETG